MRETTVPSVFGRRGLVAVLSSLLAVLLLVAAPATASAAPNVRPDQRVSTIAQARHAPLGTVVTIEGTVTTPSGAFASSYSDQGFGVQDRTAGIFVSFPTTNINVAPPRHVRVTGTLTNSVNGGLLAIAPASPADVAKLGNDRPVQPRFVRTGAVGSANEGLIVRAIGRITVGPLGDGTDGSKMSINDGSGDVNVYANVGTGVDLTNARLFPRQLVVITGFSSQFDGTPEIDIRGPRDIVRLTR